MPYIPHTSEDVAEMLQAIGADSMETLFDEVPADLPQADLSEFPVGINEIDMKRVMMERAPDYFPGGCFIGAGAYEHHIPSIVWEIARRGEFYSAYTPYQAEASQGTLQVIYEYQSMMANLMGFDVSNASLYDGATALAESVLMALRIKKNNANRVLLPATLHPHYKQVLKTIFQQRAIIFEEVPFDHKTGAIDFQKMQEMNSKHLAAVIISQPNFFGVLEAVDELTNFAKKASAIAIAVVNPIAMALLKPPGQWGEEGADIVCGEGQPLGIPLSSGGPYFGFICTKKEFVRQLPGRIVGQTLDKEGKIGYVLTLQAREQNIRRAKATSNICTNQGLMVTAAAIYLSVMGSKGLRQVALKSHENAQELYERLTRIPGVEAVFNSPFFHEFVLKIHRPVAEVLRKLIEHNIQGGFDISGFYPELGNALLICATETKNKSDLARYEESLLGALT
jgi:glycine dehydrogenase subunit 1